MELVLVTFMKRKKPTLRCENQLLNYENESWVSFLKCRLLFVLTRLNVSQYQGSKEPKNRDLNFTFKRFKRLFIFRDQEMQRALFYVLDHIDCNTYL